MPKNLAREVNIDLGYNLVPSGFEPLPDPMLLQMYITVWRHQATMSTDSEVSCSRNSNHKHY